MEIRADDAISFVNIWECGGSGRQKSLLAALREKSALIAACDGFVGMALHASLDGTRAASYARWRNLAALQEAVKDNSVVRYDQIELANWGEPKSNVFHIERVYLPLQ